MPPFRHGFMVHDVNAGVVVDVVVDVDVDVDADVDVDVDVDVLVVGVAHERPICPMPVATVPMNAVQSA